MIKILNSSEQIGLLEKIFFPKHYYKTKFSIENSNQLYLPFEEKYVKKTYVLNGNNDCFLYGKTAWVNWVWNIDFSNKQLSFDF
jgi:hypothetical protein